MGISFNADEVFEMGMNIETNGMAYYRKASEITKDPALKKIFDMLFSEEQKHLEVFKGLRDSLPPAVTSPTASDPDDQEYLYLDALVKSRLFGTAKEAEAVAAKAGGPVQILEEALRFEKDTILFFDEMKSRTREDLGKKEIDKLIGEEKRHVQLISKEIKKIQG